MQAKAAGRDPEVESLRAEQQEVEAGRATGQVLRSPEGHAVGLALWTALKGLGRRVSPIYLARSWQNPEGWTSFLRGLLERPDPDGPVLLFNGPLTGFAEADAVRVLAPRGFQPFHRFGMTFPPGGALPVAREVPESVGRLRTVGPVDSEALARLGADSYAGTVDRFLFGQDPDPISAARSLLQQLFEGKYGAFLPEASFGLEIDGRLQGATLVTRRPSHKLLADVEVHPSVQGKGFARALIHATLEALAADRSTPLVLAVTKENGGAFQLYEKMGFVVTDGPFTFWADTQRLGIRAPVPAAR